MPRKVSKSEHNGLPKVTYEDNHGSYSMHFENGILCTTVAGLVGVGFINHFKTSAETLIPFIKNTFWAHFGDYRQFQAIVPQAENTLIEIKQYFHQNQCVRDAYCVTSPVGKGQLTRVRKLAGIISNIEDRIHHSPEEALNILTQHLSNEVNA